MNRNEQMILEWMITGGGELPLLTTMRLYQSGVAECMVANWWLAHGMGSEAGTYRMLLSEAAMQQLKQQIDSAGIAKGNTTYGTLYADSGTEQLAVLHEGSKSTVQWNPNCSDELPGGLRSLHAAMQQLLDRAKNYPRQVLHCALIPAGAGVLRLAITCKGSQALEIKNEDAKDISLYSFVVPGNAAAQQSAGFYRQAYQAGPQKRLPGSITGDHRLLLQPGSTVHIDFGEDVNEEKPLPYTVYALVMLTGFFVQAEAVSWQKLSFLLPPVAPVDSGKTMTV